MTSVPHWLTWARKVQAIAQVGLTFAENDYDRARYAELHELAIEMFATQTGADQGTVSAWFAIQPGYATPKVDVRGACFCAGKLLLVRERSDGGWCLPGGWADVGDVPSLAAEREVAEEAGYECKAQKVIGVFDANRHGEPLSAYHGYKLIFKCEISGGDGKPNHETDGVDFFSRAEIATLPLSTPRSSLEQLLECFAHLDDPTRATVFD
ncbi:MAG: NUDIX hydrolase N-terminal domain-containing protein [Chloroflexota bacterium]|nr:NUDIX hydrolase N-terminal domain-containing protein [Chloroflexota bacterium]